MSLDWQVGYGVFWRGIAVGPSQIALSRTVVQHGRPFSANQPWKPKFFARREVFKTLQSPPMMQLMNIAGVVARSNCATWTPWLARPAVSPACKAAPESLGSLPICSPTSLLCGSLTQSFTSQKW